MNKALVFAATLVSAVAVAATAQPAATTAAPEEKPAAEEKTICRNVSEVGSRLSRRRVCATKAQWDEMNAQNRLAVDRIQGGRQTQGN
ncbi:MAG: hypothetical protein M3177_11385 [Pseudomonadota bacterium]|nr:hypothetical protein [Pseudomonadota bacterium]